MVCHHLSPEKLVYFPIPHIDCRKIKITFETCLKHYSLTTLYTDQNPSFPASNTRFYMICFLFHPRLMSRSQLFPGLPSPFPLLQHNKLFCTGNPPLLLRELMRTRLHWTLKSYFTFQRGILCLPSKSLIFHSCCSLLASGCNLCLSLCFCVCVWSFS